MIYDRKTEERLETVMPVLSTRWKQVAKDMWDLHKIQIKVTCGMRTFSEQWGEWGKGRLKEKNGTWVICDIRKVVTYAKPGQSYHNYGLALDSCFMGSDPFLERIDKGDAIKLWNEYGRLCKVNGLEWGGDWKRPDRPHCELTFGQSYHDVQIVYENLGLKAVWAKCEALSKCGMEIV